MHGHVDVKKKAVEFVMDFYCDKSNSAQVNVNVVNGIYALMYLITIKLNITNSVKASVPSVMSRDSSSEDGQ